MSKAVAFTAYRDIVCGLSRYRLRFIVISFAVYRDASGKIVHLAPHISQAFRNMEPIMESQIIFNEILIEWAFWFFFNDLKIHILPPWSKNTGKFIKIGARLISKNKMETGDIESVII